ncbi:MAG TPA: plastocyanin/azurin family copper-binding protein [Thermoleophilaceae bacterium]|nr:plastocyanin/azurin family copper-binding protein [Thermoleophilaceae bacterium]
MRLRLPAILLASATLAGCGGEDDEPGATATVPSGSAVVVKGDEYSFDPETLVVTGGGDLKVTFQNDGALAHNMRIERGGDDVGGSPTFQGGGEKRDFSLSLEPGEYKLICTVGNHEELGMTGKLEVR